jgi:copper transport protein
MRLALIILWFLVSALCCDNRALAHASLVESQPADGIVLEQVPPTMRLRFNEPVSPLVVIFTDSQGRTHRGLASTSRDEMLEIALPPDLPCGSQLLSFRVTSGDGHPVSGSIIFSIGAPSGSTEKPATESNDRVRTVLWLMRTAFSIGLFACVGGAFFQSWIASDLSVSKTNRILFGLLAMSAVAAVLSLGLQGLDALGLSLEGLDTPAAWTAGWQTSFGATVIVALAALTLAWASLRIHSLGWRRSCSLIALIAVGLSLASSGHASAAAPQWLTRPAVFIHIVGVTYWVGALIPLVIALLQAPAQAVPSVRRFSNGALVAVAAMTLAGIVLAAIQVEQPANLMGTAYGQVLLAKIALVAALLGLAALNRLWLTPILKRADNSSNKPLIRSIGAEIVLVAAILALAGLWRFTPPPRALTSNPQALAIHLHSPTIIAQVTFRSDRTGANRATVMISSIDAMPLDDPKDVTLILSKPDAGIEPFERHAAKTDQNNWVADGLALPLAGPWQVKVAILVSDFEKADLEGSLSLKP